MLLGEDLSYCALKPALPPGLRGIEGGFHLFFMIRQCVLNNGQRGDGGNVGFRGSKGTVAGFKHTVGTFARRATVQMVCGAAVVVKRVIVGQVGGMLEKREEAQVEITTVFPENQIVIVSIMQ